MIRILLELLADIVSLPPCVAGIDKWIPLTPISKDDDVQGEVLVEMSMEPATESEVASSMHPHTVGGPASSVDHARELHLTLKQDFFILLI